MNDNEAESVTYCYWHGNLCKQWCAGYKVTYATTNIYWQTWHPWNYRDEVRLLCGKEIGEERTRLLKAIGGEAFPQLKLWPREIRLMFWKKPPGDQETFKLVLFS